MKYKFNKQDLIYYATIIQNFILIILQYAEEIIPSFAISLGLMILIVVLQYFIQRKGIAKYKDFEPLILMIVCIQSIYQAFVSPVLDFTTIALLKIQEISTIEQISKVKAISFSFLLNISIILLLIKHNGSYYQYFVIFYFAFMTLRPKHIINKPANDTLKWQQHLQNIPIGIMIISKETLKPIFYNNQLQTLFPQQDDVQKLIMEGMYFKILNFKYTQPREASVVPIMKQFIITKNNSTQKITNGKITSNQRIQNNLNVIIKDFVDGKIEKHNAKDSYLELQATIEARTYQSVSDEDRDRNIQCKIYLGSNEGELLVLIDDITRQTSLSKLETREKFKVRMVESFSHELRTPLHGATLFIEALINDLKTSKDLIEKYANPALNALKLQSYLIKDIIDFTQFHSNQIKYEIKEFTFEDLIQEISQIIGPLYEMKNIGLHLNVKNTIHPIIYSDFDRLMQILINILQNALKNSSKGQVVIEIEGKESSLLFTVTDQGVGIDKEKLDEIKEFLRELNKTSDVAYQGKWQGLGLLISQLLLFRLAPQQKSLLRIESKGPNQGTKVQFKIKTNRSFNTQNITNATMKKASIQQSLTAPDMSFGIQGLLIIHNRTEIEQMINPQLQQIPTKRGSALANFFRPNSQNLSINIFHNETDLQEQDCEYIDSASRNLEKLIRRSKKSHQFISDLQDFQIEQIQQKRRRLTSFSLLDKQEKKQNTLISRLKVKEELEIQMEKQFENISYGCNCNLVLSVDDEIFNQRALQLIVSQLGYNLQIAFNGMQALGMLKKQQKCSEQCSIYNFILMDCQMPVLDGWKTTKILQDMMERKEIPKIPIIGLTAFNGALEVQECFNSGMIAVLAKPLKVHELKELLISIQNQRS